MQDLDTNHGTIRIRVPRITIDLTVSPVKPLPGRQTQSRQQASLSASASSSDASLLAAGLDDRCAAPKKKSAPSASTGRVEEDTPPATAQQRVFAPTADRRKAPPRTGAHQGKPCCVIGCSPPVIAHDLARMKRSGIREDGPKVWRLREIEGVPLKCGEGALDQGRASSTGARISMSASTFTRPLRWMSLMSTVCSADSLSFSAPPA
eukprot:jgi/Mesvir1/8750/Mv02669-RA.1